VDRFFVGKLLAEAKKLPLTCDTRNLTKLEYQ